MPKRRGGRRGARRILWPLVLAVLGAPPPAAAEVHPFLASSVDYLPVPADAECRVAAVSPDGARAYLADYTERIFVVDTALDTVARTIVLPTTDSLDGIGFSPTGRLLVAAEYTLYELDPTTHAILHEVPAPWSYGGNLAFTADGTRAYVAAGYDIFVLDLANGALAFVDTTPLDPTVDGLFGANPGWDWYRAWELRLSPDGNRLYFYGDNLYTEPWLPALQVIDGLAAGDFAAGLTFQLIDYGCSPLDGRGTYRLALSQDGGVLVDSCGNLFNAADMSLLSQIPFATWDGWGSNLMRFSPDGRYLIFEGYALLYNGQDRVTDSGEGLLVFDLLTQRLVDLDGDPGNGLTGIDLPNAPDWYGYGAWNGYDMEITPNGKKLYLAAGGEGAVVVRLGEGGASGAVVPARGGNGGELTMRIVGHYAQGSSVILRQGSERPALETTLGLTGNLEARFDLKGAAVGVYDVLVRPPSGPDAVLPQAFTVEEARQGAVVNMSGTSTVRADESARFLVNVENTGNNDLTDLLVSVNLGADIEYRVELPAAVPGGETRVDTELTTSAADVPETIWLARLAPRDSYSFWLTIQASAGSWQDDAERELEVKAFLLGDFENRVLRGLLGDACSFGEAFVKHLGAALAQQGYATSADDLRRASQAALLDAAKDFGVSKVKGLAEDAIKKLLLVAVPEVAIPLAVLDLAKDLKSCLEFFSETLKLLLLFPMDPNDKVTASGIDGYVLPGQAILYTIFFENQPAATAAARDVVVTDRLDANLDAATFEVIESSHPAVLTTAFDAGTRDLTFRFDGIDLPPNATPREGEGRVTFRVRPKAGLPSGTAIRNQASIVFDSNAPIVTREVVNVIDADAPVSQVSELAPESTCSPLVVSWTGHDDGVGVRDYTLYVSEDGQPATPWLLAAPETSATLAGAEGSTYAFSVVARDRLGHVEPLAAAPGATTICRAAGGGDGGGCGCRVAGRPTGGVLLLLLLFGLGGRRRGERRGG